MLKKNQEFKTTTHINRVNSEADTILLNKPKENAAIQTGSLLLEHNQYNHQPQIIKNNVNS